VKIIYDRNTQKVPVKIWDGDGKVPFADNVIEQVVNMSKLPFIHKHISLMPDGHLGRGAAVGSVIPTRGAIVPASVGTDLGCGMVAVKTSLSANDLPDSLGHVRGAIEKMVPHGRTGNGKAADDDGAWSNIPGDVGKVWNDTLADGLKKIVDKYPRIGQANSVAHLGTLGTGNHFIEVCLDLEDRVWIMLHSGSRGVGNSIGQRFINAAKEEMERYFIGEYFPDKDLSYLVENTEVFDDYIEAVSWAQSFAMTNREIMMSRTIQALQKVLPPFRFDEMAINCHHNYISMENHNGKNVYVTRKGAIRARLGDLGIIPGSMGAKSFIVKGLGNSESFCSCSHGAGRVMSRTEAKKKVSLEDFKAQTEGVECRKDEDVIDEAPSAYKNVVDVLAAQTDLVEIVAELRQVICVKG